MNIDHKHVSLMERVLGVLVFLALKIVRSGQRVQGRRVLRRMKSCGKGVGVWGRFHVTGAEHMEVGDNVHFGDNAYIRAEGGLIMGENTHIAKNLVLYTINHDFEGARIPYDDRMIEKPVVIGRNVWVGMNVCIAPGTVIGDGAIIGLGSVVSGTVPPLAIVGAEKWRVIGHRDRERYESLDEDRAYGGPDGIRFYAGDQ